MSWGEEQKKEIATIRERNIVLKLSDADVERITNQAAEFGLTVGELLANFIGDLVDGTYSNGSDERDLAFEYTQRCWYSWNESLLSWLHENGYLDEWCNRKDFIADDQELISELESKLAKGDKLTEEEQSDLDEAREGIVFQQEILDNILKEYLETVHDPEETLLKKEIEEVERWHKEKQNLTRI